MKGMDTMNTNTRSQSHSGDTFDWVGQIRLAFVLSIAAAIVAIGLADRVAEPALVIGTLVVASIAGWRRVGPPRVRPARLHTRRN